MFRILLGKPLGIRPHEGTRRIWPETLKLEKWLRMEFAQDSSSRELCYWRRLLRYPAALELCPKFSCIVCYLLCRWARITPSV